MTVVVSVLQYSEIPQLAIMTSRSGHGLRNHGPTFVFQINMPNLIIGEHFLEVNIGDFVVIFEFFPDLANRNFRQVEFS